MGGVGVRHLYLHHDCRQRKGNYSTAALSWKGIWAVYECPIDLQVRRGRQRVQALLLEKSAGRYPGPRDMPAFQKQEDWTPAEKAVFAGYLSKP